MSSSGIYLIAAAAVVGLLVGVQLISLVGPTHFLATVILGQDQRTSTSKTFILMWTLLVGWALVALLIAGELVHQHGCVKPHHLEAAATACKKAKDDVGVLQVGWLKFLHAGLSGSYLVLLGVPAAAGVAAKGITQSHVNNAGFKTTKPKAGFQPFARLAEVFSADDGTTDIGDFQYMIFNLVTAAYFVAQFLKPNASGLPTIPDTLLGLTSVSAGLYVGKKAVTRSQPKVTGVFPQPVHANEPFTIIGVGLTEESTAPTDTPPRVTVEGLPALNVHEVEGNITAVLPPTLVGAGAPTVRHLMVQNPYGGVTPSFEIHCL